MRRQFAPRLLVCSLGLLGPLGCANSHMHALSSGLFVPASELSFSELPLTAAPATVGPATIPATLPTIAQPDKASVLPPPEDSGAAFQNIKPIEALAAEPVKLPGEPSQALPSQTESAAAPLPAFSEGQPAVAALTPVLPGSTPQAGPDVGQGVYMTVGGVVAIVNDTPVYANQILDPLNRELSVKARELSETEFRHFVIQELARQFRELVDDEQYFAIAYHGLTDDDRKLAQAIMVQIRQERITAAGGSVEQARRRSLEQREDFDESLKQEYRRIIAQLYRRRRIEPLVQVTADDMREFYRLNSEKLYGDKDKARFRVIEIDPAIAGSQQAALDKITAIREKALHGEDFAALASADNDNSFLKGRGGSPTDPGEWTDRNTYPIDAVEAAVWKIEPGQITPIISTNNALYIAKLDARHLGMTKSFEERMVQDDIYGKLRQRQLAALSEKSREDSLGIGMVETDEDRIQIAVDMAMQKYAQLHE